jgi:allantoicase
MFFGSRHNMIFPGVPRGMHDGWETRRRRGPGHDWAVVKLGRRGVVGRVTVDTTHFKGNAPGSCSLEVTDSGDDADADATAPLRENHPWRELLPNTPLRPHAVHDFARELTAPGPATHARLNIFPDGGVARLRLWGRIVAP